jgi:hypothetical protein
VFDVATDLTVLATSQCWPSLRDLAHDCRGSILEDGGVVRPQMPKPSDPSDVAHDDVSKVADVCRWRRPAMSGPRTSPRRPEKPGRPYLCRNLDAVGLALLAHRSAVCGKANGRRCPPFESCGYLAQSNRAHDADVLIVAHEFLFERLPTAVLHDVAYVIVEEDFIPTGDAIAEASRRRVPPALHQQCARARSPRRSGRGEDSRPSPLLGVDRRHGRRRLTTTSPRMRSSAITSRKQMRDTYGTCTGNGGEMPRCIPACRSPNGARRSTTLQSLSYSLGLPP